MLELCAVRELSASEASNNKYINKYLSLCLRAVRDSFLFKKLCAIFPRQEVNVIPMCSLPKNNMARLPEQSRAQEQNMLLTSLKQIWSG